MALCRGEARQSLFTLIFHSYKMSDDEKFDAPDADIILRALGPPERDFRVHKFLLSLASPVFKHMFSLPRPTSDNSGESTVAEVEIVEVTDPAEALDIVLRMIYPSFTSPSLGRDFDFDTSRGMPGHRGQIRNQEDKITTM